MSEPSDDEAGPGALAKLAIDLGPLIVFFAANAWRGIFTATLAFMIAIAAAILFRCPVQAFPPSRLSGVMVLVWRIPWAAREPQQDQADLY